MIRRHGFTLIEVLLSIAIFMIISVGFFTMFSAIFMNTYQTSQLTEDSFLAQKEIESTILAVKSALNENAAPEGMNSSTVILFTGEDQRSVTAYHIIQFTNHGQPIETYLSEIRPPKLQTPSITSGVHISAFASALEQTYPNIGMQDLSIDLSVELRVDNPGILVRYLYYWYISDSGFYVKNSPPIFPDDYQIITESTSRSINTIPIDYAGRFIKLVVTPVGEKGQFGVSIESNALYISPLPINEDLIYQLDASSIDKNDPNIVRSTLSNDELTLYLQKWIDGGPYGADLKQSDFARQPVLYDYSIEGRHTVQGTTGIPESNTGTLQTLNSISIGGKLDMTVYIAAKFDDGYPNNTIIFESKSIVLGGNRWTLETNEVGNLVLCRYLNSEQTSETRTVINENINYRGSLWHLIKLEIFQDRLAIIIDGVVATDTNYSATSVTMQLTDFKVHFDSRLVLGEVLIYDVKHMTGSQEENSIQSYLNEKY